MEDNNIKEDNKINETENKEKVEYKLTNEECGCTMADFINSLRFIPKDALLAMVEEGKIEAVCENCGTEYKIQGEDLEKVKEMAENSTSISGCDVSCCDGCSGCN